MSVAVGVALLVLVAPDVAASAATAEPTPTPTATPTASPTATPEAGTSGGVLLAPAQESTTLGAGDCTQDVPCVVRLDMGQYGRVVLALGVLVFLALVFVLARLGRR